TAVALGGLNLTAQNLRNNGNARIEVGSSLSLEQKPANTNANSLQGALTGAFDLALGPDLMPATATGKLDAKFDQASGSFREIRGLTATLTTDLAPTELKRLAVEFSRDGAALGAIRA